eukprot:s845_g13.t1
MLGLGHVLNRALQNQSGCTDVAAWRGLHRASLFKAKHRSLLCSIALPLCDKAGALRFQMQFSAASARALQACTCCRTSL